MIIHSVFFWLKSTLTPEEIESFVIDLENLEEIDEVDSLYVGRPAPIERAVVDSTYTFGLIVHFDTLEDHNAYQVAPLHKKFLERHKHQWDKVQIYDVTL